jgi:hypothetical protein
METACRSPRVRRVNWKEDSQIVRIGERSRTTISQIIKMDLNSNGLSLDVIYVVEHYGVAG